MSMTLALDEPSPNTVCVACFQRGQARQRAASSRTLLSCDAVAGPGRGSSVSCDLLERGIESAGRS